DQPVGVHRIAIEDIRAGIRLADLLLIDALADFHTGMLLDVELRPAGSEIFDKDAVAVIAKRIEKFLALRLGDEFGRNLNDNLAISLVGVDPLDVVNELPEVELEAGEPQVGFFIHPINGNIDLVDTGFQNRPDPFGRQEGAVRRGVDVVDTPRRPGIGNHIGHALVEERLAVLVHAQHLDRLFEVAEVVDDLLEELELHDALEAAGLGDHVAMPGRAERAFEIAGARRIHEDDERGCQRNDGFERRAPDEIYARFEAG